MARVGRQADGVHEPQGVFVVCDIDLDVASCPARPSRPRAVRWLTTSQGADARRRSQDTSSAARPWPPRAPPSRTTCPDPPRAAATGGSFEHDSRADDVARGRPRRAALESHPRPLGQGAEADGRVTVGASSRSGYALYGCYLRVGDPGPCAGPWAGIARLEMPVGHRPRRRLNRSGAGGWLACRASPRLCTGTHGPR